MVKSLQHEGNNNRFLTGNKEKELTMANKKVLTVFKDTKYISYLNTNVAGIQRL